MEENKKKETEKKEAKKAEPKKPAAPVENRLTYEQLSQVAAQLSQQNNQLRAQLKEIETARDLEIIRLLLDIIKNEGAFNTTFIDKCVDAVEDVVTTFIAPPEQNTVADA